MIKVVDEVYNRDDWNKHAVHPMQSWEWGEARKQMGIEVIRVEETGPQHNVFQLTIHAIPYTPYKIGYLPRSVFPSKQVIDFLYNYGRKNNIVSIKLEPNDKGEKREIQKQVQDDKRLMVSPTPLFPKWTQTIDLTKSEEDIFKSLKSKTRYNVRLAQKKGVTVKEMTNKEGFEIFIKLYFETTKRQHYFGHNKEYHDIIFSTLKDSIAHILIAYYDGKPMAAYELFVFGDVLYYPYGGSSIENKEVMAPNLIMWETIRFGKTHGATSFDLWGSLGPDYSKDHIWAGFTRFKEGYGAQFTEMIGSFDLVINPLLYKGLTLAQKVRERLMS